MTETVRIADWADSHPDYTEGIAQQIFFLELETEGDVYFDIDELPPVLRERWELTKFAYLQKAVEEILCDPPPEAWA